MIRVEHCCCGCTLDIGARIAIWTDMITTIVIGLSILGNIIRGEYYEHEFVWAASAFIIPVKLVILIGAVIGVNKKNASYLQPYIVYNALAIFTMGVIIVLAYQHFDEIIADDSMVKYLMGPWEVVKKQYQSDDNGAKIQSGSSGEPIPEINPMSGADIKHSARVFFLNFTIICGIIHFFLWTYLNVVLYSYCKTLREGGNITNADGVEYFAPTEQIVGKSVPRGAPSQYNIQPSYFAAAPYPTQSYSQAPPAYDEATHPNSAYANSSFPSTNQ